jgi:hypothetical protein
MNGDTKRVDDGGVSRLAQMVTMANIDSASLVRSDVVLKDVTPVLDTAIYASGDVLFIATEIITCVYAGCAAIIPEIVVIDKDDEGAAFDLYFFSATASMGALNAAATSISDADTAKYLGKVVIATSDYEDEGGAKVARVKTPSTADNPSPIFVAGDASATSIFVIGVSRGTPTYTTASDIILRIPFVR